jgi:hypothetical protein
MELLIGSSPGISDFCLHMARRKSGPFVPRIGIRAGLHESAAGQGRPSASFTPVSIVFASAAKQSRTARLTLDCFAYGWQ